MFARFTERAREAVVLAQAEARALRHNYIGTEHLLLGLVREEEGIAASVLRAFGIGVDDVRGMIRSIVGEGDELATGATGQISFTQRAKGALELALREASAMGHEYIGTEHLLLGVVGQDGGVGADIVEKLGTNREAVRDEVLRVLGGNRP
jgi:ATP-dependent Clp protease ATP-binding subunit ClpC